MGGIVGRLFREFAVTLSVALMVSLVVSLTTVPMMCALLLRREQQEKQSLFHRMMERGFGTVLRGYDRSLTWALNHPRLVMLILLTTIVSNVELYRIVPKGFFPQQDTGIIIGNIQADQSISFQLMRQKLQQFIEISRKDPAVDSVAGLTGGGGGVQTNSGIIFMSLKPVRDRKITADQVVARLTGELAQVPGATLFLQAVQDFRIGGRPANAQYQYTLQAGAVEELTTWAPRIVAELQKVPVLSEVNSDQQDKGLETDIMIDRNTAARLGISVAQIDNTLYDAFGQRQVSTIYNARNQYHVIMEVAPPYWQDPETLQNVYISKSASGVGGIQGTNAVAGTVLGLTPAANSGVVAADAARNLALNSIGNTGRGAASTGTAVSTRSESMVPLSAIIDYVPGHIPLAVTHQGLFVASTISFNVAPNASLSDAVAAIDDVMRKLLLPESIHGTFEGTAKVFRDSLSNEVWLFLAALIAIYIVLGVLYESYIHPVTILSTLPSAGLGAVLALIICNTEFSVIALIGVILLIGIVKKNAIMMIDFALDAERAKGLMPKQAIYKACLLRFRPIMMTTGAALFGALPLAIGMGDGAELRRPLGIAIIGGLILNQLLTLYTTPVIYLYLDRFNQWLRALRLSKGPLVPGE
jgi:multidrug efflux pump